MSEVLDRAVRRRTIGYNDSYRGRSEGTLGALAAVFGMVSLLVVLGAYLNAVERISHDSDGTASEPVRRLGLRPPVEETIGVLLEGTVEGYSVAVERAPFGARLRIVVDGRGKIPRGLRWGPKGHQVETVRLSQTRTGRLVRLLAQVAHPYRLSPIVALLSPKQRAKVAHGLKRLGVEVCEGELSREVGANLSGAGLARRIRNTVRLVDILARGIRPACERALTSDDPAVRLEAACVLEERGLPTLRALAVDDRAPVAVRLDALRNLDAAGDRETWTAALMHALEGPQDEVCLFAIEALGEMKHRPAVAPIVRLLRRPATATAVAAANALGAIGDAAAEGALIAALGSESAEVQAAAAEALGVVGTAVAVEPLLASAKSSWLPTRLDAVVRDAVRRIQARAPGADVGQLSIADDGPGRGALSEAADAASSAGALTLPEVGEERTSGPRSSGEIVDNPERSRRAAHRAGT